MALDFQILGSSSSGNSGLLKSTEAKILIDAGFTAKKLKQLLANAEKSIDNVDAVFFTHEHTDHTQGLRGLSRHPHLQFFANQDTAETLQRNLARPVKWNIFETGHTFRFKDLEISSFSIPHDAQDPVGFLFKDTGVNKSLAWVTDLGHLPRHVKEKVRHAETLVIECNYDPSLLESDTKRPWPIKQRIKSRHGHLSNQDAFEFIAQTLDPKWQRIFLVHLSRDCNCVDRVRKTFAPLINNGNPYNIEIVAP